MKLTHKWPSISSLTGALGLLALVACSTPPGGDNSSNATGGGGLDGANLGDGSEGDGTATAADGALTDGSAGSDGTAGGACNDGESACQTATVVKVCVGGKWIFDDKCATPKICKDGACAEVADCTPGESGGCAGYALESVCSDDGTAWLDKPCPLGELCAAGKCRVTQCVPGIAECLKDNTFHVCLDDGSDHGPEQSCKTGATCLGGKCVSLCEQNLKFVSNVGCEYWSADLDNADDDFGSIAGGENPMHVPHSVVISNPGIYDAEITFTVPAPYKLSIGSNVVPAGKSIEFKMPEMNVDGDSISKKGIHVESTQPVVAYQFNPFNADKAFSNDGSLLIPHNALGTEYYAITMPSRPDFAIPGMPAMPSQNGYFTVLATRPGTTKVTVTLSGNGYVAKAPGTGLQLSPKQTAVFSLEQSEVLNLECMPLLSTNLPNLSGTHIVADKPVAVFSGHEELVLGYPDGPEDSCCAEHVEEQLLPVKAWGHAALCPKTKPRGSEPDMWIVMAGPAGANITTIPPIPGLDGAKLTAGQYKEVWTPLSFMVKSDAPIQVGQYIVSQEQTDDWIGDPTFIIHAPTNQFRQDYFILTPKGYSENYASVVRPVGSKSTLDGAAIPDGGFVTFGDGTWELGYVSLAIGDHTIEGDQSFGLTLYGYGPATAYGYPGGMNLQ